MKEIQKQHWEVIRKSKLVFFLKYIAIFYIPVILVILLFFVTRGFQRLYISFLVSSFSEILLTLFLVFGWIFVAINRGKVSWNTWEKEYLGEVVFATTYNQSRIASTGYTDSPYKELFFTISTLIFTLTPLILFTSLIVGKLGTIDKWLNNYSLIQNLSTMLTGIIFVLLFAIVLFVGSFIGMFFLLIVLRPFYRLDEVKPYLSFSIENMPRILNIYTLNLQKIAKFVYKS